MGNYYWEITPYNQGGGAFSSVAAAIAAGRSHVMQMMAKKMYLPDMIIQLHIKAGSMEGEDVLMWRGSVRALGSWGWMQAAS